MKTLIGIDEHGTIVRHHSIPGYPYEIIFIAEGRKALGKKIQLKKGKEIGDFPPVRLGPSDRKFSVVIGYRKNGRLLSNVKISQKRLLKDLVMPERAKKCFEVWGWSFKSESYLALKNDEGDCVYVRRQDAVPLSHIRAFIIK